MDNFGRNGAGVGEIMRNTPERLDRPSVPLDVVHHTLESTQRMAFRLFELEARLLGPRPVSTDSVGNTKGERSYAGVFGELQEHALTVQRVIDEANDALARIESQLP